MKKGDKRSVSAIVAYVVLITIAISLSVLVYNWLRFYVSPEPEGGCPDGISLVIQDYHCDSGTGGMGLNITLKNKGLFTINGFILRVHDREDAEIGLYNFTNDGSALNPGDKINNQYLFSQAGGGLSPEWRLEKITLIEVQPFIIENNQRVFCDKVASHRVEGCGG